MWFFKDKNKEKALTLDKGFGGIRHAIKRLFGKGVIGSVDLAAFEEELISCDISTEITSELLKSIKNKDSSEVKGILKEVMCRFFRPYEMSCLHKPNVILIAGVNGSGKTTTIAKLSKKFVEEEKKVLIIAADTFRAAAIEQLEVWGRRVGVEVFGKANVEPAAIAYDGVEKGKAIGADVILVDTAGRLHNNQNLMEEIKKIDRVIKKSVSTAPHERILIIDGTVGNNGLTQAKIFNDALNLTSVIIAKLDGTAKGGVLFSIAYKLKLPISYVGIGEGMDDLKPFDPSEFVDSLML